MCTLGQLLPPWSRLLLILLLAAGLRWYGIGSESIWLDESTSIKLARMDIPTAIQWTAIDEHPPLYFVLLHYWLALGDSEVIIRSLSALAGILTIPVVYQLGSLLFNNQSGLWAALFLAVSPFHIWYSQEARMYSWLTLFMATAALCALWAWRTRHWAAWAGYVAAAVGALYTHYYGPFVLAAPNVFFVYLLLRRRLDRRTVWTWIACQALVVALFIPWIPTLYGGFTAGKAGAWRSVVVGKPSLAVFGQTAIFFMVGGARELVPVLVRRLGYAAFLAMFALGLWPVLLPREGERPLFDQNEAIAFCLLYLALPLGTVWVYSHIVRAIYLSRYAIPFLIPFLLLVARGVQAVRPTLARGIVVLLLVGVMGYGAAVQAQTMDKPDWRSLAREITQQAQAGDVVLFVPGWHIKPFDYYARGGIELYDGVPLPSEHGEAAALAGLEKAIVDRERVWLVWETGHYSDPSGAVYRYLQQQMRETSARSVPLIGQVSLFERGGAGGERK